MHKNLTQYTTMAAILDLITLYYTSNICNALEMRPNMKRFRKIIIVKIIVNKNENRLENTRICEKETYLNFTMTMEHVVAYGIEWSRQM